ncbi:MAG: tripartite tricarboxylate transporter substrate binding protein [Burkholderiales bacterium]|nr:tripartite tricarboxylate transporter substrate binding protein [Burkholderiales bacterium]
MTTRLLAVLAVLAVAGAVQAQPWPSKPIRIVNGNAPGGSADVTARVVGDVAARGLGQSFIVENRPGAGGGIALDTVVRAAPDAYTLLISADSSLYHPLLRPGTTVNPEKQLTPVIILTTQPLVLAVHSSLGIKTAAEFVARAKAAPAPLPYATPSATGTQVVAAEAFFRAAGIKLTNIPYKGGGQAVGDLASGQVPVGVLGSAPLVPHAAAGRVVLLAVSSKNRSGVLPNVPTMAEAGYPGIDLAQWFGILGPAGMPREAVARLSAEFQKALADPEVKQRLATAALEGVGGSPEDMARRMREESVVWLRIAKEVGMRVE